MADSPNGPRPGPPTGPRWEEAGDADVPAALTALYPPAPETLCVLYAPRWGRYCYRQLPPSEDCGLVCFLSPQQARAYADARRPSWPYDEVRHVSLDQAHAMARERHAFVNCLILVDEAGRPSARYIK